MTRSTCPHPLIVHRGWGIVECPDPGCAAVKADHSTWLPCRWAWRYAHGRAAGSHPFPGGRCPGCYHIRRAGQPTELTETLTRGRSA